MTSEALAAALSSVVERIIDMTKDDPGLRSNLRHLAEAILMWTAPAADQMQDVTTKAESENTDVAVESIPTAGRVELEGNNSKSPEVTEALGPLPELTLGGPVIRQVEGSRAVATYSKSLFPVDESDLTLIETRCRLKAEGARWAAQRRRLVEDGAVFSTEVDPFDRNIIARAKEIPDCFLWMCHPTGPSPTDIRQYEDVAGCFDAVADVITILRRLLAVQDSLDAEFERCLDLLAEAQSALRAAVQRIEGPMESDQNHIFAWLRSTVNQRQIFIQRFMRADDPADPTQWADLASRVESLDTTVEGLIARSRQRKKRLGKIRHKVSLIASGGDGAFGHWQAVAQIVHELVEDGMHPSNAELREILLPAIDELPDFEDVPREFDLVLREIDRFLALQPSGLLVSKRTGGNDPDIQTVAGLLEGRSMVLIGGDCRPEAHSALKEAFRLKDLEWVETRPHQSVTDFEPYVARPGVAVVLLAIRWSSHSHGDVKMFCDHHAKPLVRLPGGYNPRQIAVQILKQCSDKLKRA